MTKEIDIERMSDEDRMNLEAGWYCRKKTREEAENELNREIITGTPFNEIDDITTQKKIDIACFLPPCKNQEFGRELRENVLTSDDEAKLKEIWKKHDEEKRKQLKKNKEKLELEEHLNEVRQEIEDEEREKENNNPLKKYEEEKIRENIRKNIKKGMLNEKEEEEIKEKFENPEVRSVYDILAGVLSFLFPYEPGENIDKNRKISESDIMDVAANLIPRMREVKKNMFYKEHKLPESKAEDVEKLAKELSGYNNAVKNGYVAPKCEFVENTLSKRGDFDGICQEMMELHRRKNNDYGNAANESYKEFGLISYVIRLNDKMKRLKTLSEPGTDISVKDESIEDTLMDLAAYAIMAIESLRNS